MMRNEPISVMIADDHPLLRSGIAAVLTADPRFTVVAEANDGSDAVTLFERLRPAITLMDLQRPGVNGIEATRAIRQLDPQALIIILTTFDGDVQVARGLQAGASGYILKNLARIELCNYILSVHAGQRQCFGGQAHGFQHDALSKREIEVLRLVAGGNTNLHVGTKLGLREDTIKAHMKSILQNLGARDSTHAVMKARRRGYWES